MERARVSNVTYHRYSTVSNTVIDFDISLSYNTRSDIIIASLEKSPVRKISYKSNWSAIVGFRVILRLGLNYYLNL